MSAELDALRATLDQLDDRIVEALGERQQVINEVSTRKATQADKLFDRDREQEILTRLGQRAAAANVDEYFVTRVFREILKHSVRRQEEHLLDTCDPQRKEVDSLTVGFQGIEGSYSHIAATQHFAARDAQIRYSGVPSFAELLQAVRDGQLDYALLPIENTTAGSINEAYDLLARMNLALVGEEVVEINHCLMALEPLPVSRIRRIYSHPQALVQCSEFLNSLTACEVHSFANTAMAARRLRDDQDLSEAAIASEEAARLYGLTILKRGVANQKEVYTRFVVVAREPAQFELRIPCKTSIIFATRHREGALAECLNVLAKHHLNLSKLESRPRPKAHWEYLFYADFDGNLEQDSVKEALGELAEHTNFLKVLGSYPARVSKDGDTPEPRPLPAAKPRTADRESKDSAGPTPSVLRTLEKKPYKLVSRVTCPDDTELRVGNVTIGGSQPVMIAGPCSVESREQLFACAERVRALGGHILRGGCFKPRTSPYAFQGLGHEGLDLLEEAGQTYGLPVITEVLHPGDIEAVAAKADIIQIGARNMQNFSLLKEVGQVNHPVMLKRGMMASIDEWLAAAEYILANGNRQVMLCERGIRTFETATRSTLDLSAVPVARERTHLPILVDPSHACGTWQWVADMAVAALACGAHGVMVEIHPDPKNAQCDGAQSLNFDRFAELMQRVR